MFDVDLKGMRELFGGTDARRLAAEPVANVFDEYRGYDDSQDRPTRCDVTIDPVPNSKSATFRVADDGGGFRNPDDIWTFFGSTGKRSCATVSGRFNSGDKQLLAVARSATVRSNDVTVAFADGQRSVTRHRTDKVEGVVIEAGMPWTREEIRETVDHLRMVSPPEGLTYTVNGEEVQPAKSRLSVTVKLPTVLLAGELLKRTVRRTVVTVSESDEPMLYELGIPVCSLSDVGFPVSLDVGQKVPVPLSRDMVDTPYLYRLIGTVLEQAGLDGVSLLSEEQQGAGFVKDAMEWVREPEAIKQVVADIYGDNVYRQSSDSVANAQAAASGATIIPGRTFTADTRRRLDSSGAMQTTSRVFPGAAESAVGMDGDDGEKCKRCGRPF